MLACSLCFVVYRRRILANRKESRKSIAGNPVFYLDDSETQAADLVVGDDKIVDVPYFSMESILAATDNFSDTNKLGSGGFGPVYKGMFPGETEIAVKRLSSHSGQGLEEFRNEVVLIAKLQHRNLVRLLGYCIQRSEKILLYEYMPNKSLDTFIFDQSRCILLNWNLRFNIILGIARGLLYLHQDSRLRIIHRDLKTGNILLDEEMNPKISDFGLARIVQGYETEANTQKVVGTYGYMSPEYAIEGLFSVKSDVFSFGVIILEIVSGKRNTSGFYRSEEALSLLGYAWRLWQERKALDLVDKRLLESCNGTEVMKSINIGLLCVQDDPSDRPTMSNVLIMLSSETTTLPSPNQPAFVGRKRTSSTSASLSSKAETISINEMTISAEDGR
ncbi:G-type lectin S-receptor-like serine/threonine-protein kinase At4g03230 isoform X2 [Coffea eugenioides]|uniref:G-type lectin S-receptor-like serine/threonine-protein kinase At4g03230 isoform X2 n=1 Tax=Coffea eugenioides TaxID=49369 RepID=UPI000F60C1D2|nr:G-type lectin S-receptor-like serine/threonine-protein kinase At4g03230 isoform X2 [Coffea eugenioides]